MVQLIEIHGAEVCSFIVPGSATMDQLTILQAKPYAFHIHHWAARILFDVAKLI